MIGTSPHDTPRATWTEERVAELKRLRAAGYSMSQIARELGGVTRNAVIGRLHRLGVKGVAEVKPPAAEVAAEMKRDMARIDPPKRSHLRKPDAEKRAPIRAAPPIVIDEAPLRCDPVDGAGAGIGLMDLTNTTCRWPVHADGEPARFCGAGGADLAAGRPYCACHSRPAFVPLHRRPEGVDYRVKRGDASNAIRWRQGRGTTRYAAE